MKLTFLLYFSLLIGYAKRHSTFQIINQGRSTICLYSLLVCDVQFNTVFSFKSQKKSNDF